MKPLVLAFLALAALSATALDGHTPWTDVMQQADTDTDGSVSTTEVREYPYREDHVGFQAFMVDHFIDLDTDNDGTVGTEELKAGMMRMGMTDEEISEGFAQGFAFMPRN